MSQLSWHQQRAAGMHRLPDDIVGYSYRATNYCPECIIGKLPTHEGGTFDGWALAPSVHMTVETNLDEIALAFGIDREDERSFDQGEFPKIMFRNMTEEGETCDSCGRELAS